jgi:hypothetical protein
MNGKLLAGSVVVSAFAIIGALTALPVASGVNATLTVTKTVEGTPPADAEFVINVLCVEVDAMNGAVVDEDITFGADGGSEEFAFPAGGLQCEITEIDDGGADEVSGEGQVAIEQTISYEAEIVNTFTDDRSTTVVPTTEAPAATAAAAAGAVRAAPSFTG